MPVAAWLDVSNPWLLVRSLVIGAGSWVNILMCPTNATVRRILLI
jgi:hypothetical protein